MRSADVGACGSATGLMAGAGTIPATVYIGDPAGYVSDEIATTITPEEGPAGLVITFIEFTFTFGMDLRGSPFTCATVGGCDFTYNGSIQDVGTPNCTV